MGERVPIFPKTSVISTRLIHKNVKSIAGSKGLSPLAGGERSPKRTLLTPWEEPGEQK